MPVPASTTSAPPCAMGAATGGGHLGLAVAGVEGFGRCASTPPGTKAPRVRSSRPSRARPPRGAARRRRTRRGFQATRLPIPSSRGFFGIEHQLEPGDLVAQREAALLEPANHEFVHRLLDGGAVDQGIEVACSIRSSIRRLSGECRLESKVVAGAPLRGSLDNTSFRRQ
jgi:hypothetical protein